MKNKIKLEVYAKFDFLYNKYSEYPHEKVSEVNKLVDILILEIESNEYSPKFILTRSIYSDIGKDEVCTSAKFVIRPSIKYTLKSNDLKISFSLVNSDNFVKEFIDSILDWISEYNYNIYLEDNLKKFNSYVADIVYVMGTPFYLTFGVGDGILDISDSHIEVGLSELCIENITNLGFFSEDEYWKNLYIEKFRNVLKECNRPYDIVKIKSDITNELGIYSRKSVNKLLRKIVSRKIDCVRVGVGYVEDSESFALIEKRAVSEAEVENYELEDVLIVDNDRATVAELKSDLTKLVIFYKLMPFEKKTNSFLEIPLKEYINKCK